MARWEIYDDRRFFGRKDIIFELEQKIRQSEKRVFSIVGGPGSGKSWLLAKCQAEWLSPTKRIIPFALNCPNIFLHKGPKSLDEFDDAALNGWVDKIIASAGIDDPQVTGFRPADQIQDKIQAFAQAFGAECQAKGIFPVLLVDSYDDLDAATRYKLDSQVLDFFLSHKQFAIVIAHRDHYGLQSYTVRRAEEVIPIQKHDEKPGNRVEPGLVFRAIWRECYPELADHESEFIAHLGDFEPATWSHPFIRAFMINRFLEKCQVSQPAEWTNDDIDLCIHELVSRPYSDLPAPPDAPPNLGRFQALSPNQFQILWDIATKLPPAWTENELEEFVGVSMQDADVKPLFDAGIILSSATQRYRFEIMIGLRSLLRAYTR